MTKARKALRDRKARIPPVARLAAEKAIVTIVSIALTVVLGMTA